MGLMSLKEFISYIKHKNEYYGNNYTLKYLDKNGNEIQVFNIDKYDVEKFEYEAGNNIIDTYLEERV